jgi:phage terminase large subunit-like protein
MIYSIKKETSYDYWIDNEHIEKILSKTKHPINKDALVIAGLDLSVISDLTAFYWIWNDNGILWIDGV